MRTMTDAERIRDLEAQVQDLTLRLSAVKIITTKVNPICSQKLLQLLETMEGCKGE